MAAIEVDDDGLKDAEEAPSLSNGQLWGAGAVGAIAIAAWGKIKNFFTMVMSIFIEEFNLGNAASPCLRFLNSECKYKYSWNKVITKKYLYLKKYKTRRQCYFICDQNWIFFKWKFGGIVWYKSGNLTVFRLAKFFDKFSYKIFEDVCNLDYEDDRDNFIVKNITGSSEKYGSDKGSRVDEDESDEGGSDDRSILLSIKDDILIPIYFTKEDFLMESCKEKDPFDDYFLSKDAKLIINESSKWLQHEKWFKGINVLWKRGFCIYGAPGCGKSSFVLRLAKKLKIPLFVFNLSTMNNDELIREWNRMQKPCLALFEDFDSVFEGRKNVSDIGQLQVKLTFDTVLNIIDGTNSCDGVLTFITTNHLEKLDTAILRSGRMDRHVEFKTLTKVGKEFIAKKILNGHVTLYDTLLKSTSKNESNAEFENRCIQVALDEFWKSS